MLYYSAILMLDSDWSGRTQGLEKNVCDRGYGESPASALCKGQWYSYNFKLSDIFRKKDLTLFFILLHFFFLHSFSVTSCVFFFFSFLFGYINLMREGKEREAIEGRNVYS